MREENTNEDSVEAGLELPVDESSQEIHEERLYEEEPGRVDTLLSACDTAENPQTPMPLRYREDTDGTTTVEYRLPWPRGALKLKE